MTGDAGKERLLEVGESQGGMRLDAFVAATLGIGRRAAIRVATEARVNGRRTAKGRVLAVGDQVRVPDPDSAIGDPASPPEIVSVEPDLIVLSKPSGLPSVELIGRAGPSVARWLVAERPECAGIGRRGEAGLVHRLDTGTSGLLLAARSETGYQALRQQFGQHTVEKVYLAVVAGRAEQSFEINAPIGQHRKSRTRVRALGDGPHARYTVTEAKTHVSPVRRLGEFTLVEARTSTGARHQVRAHLAHAGHPLLADRQYGGPDSDATVGYLLHASELAWDDPSSGERRRAGRDAPAGWEPLLALLTDGLASSR